MKQIRHKMMYDRLLLGCQQLLAKTVPTFHLVSPESEDAESHPEADEVLDASPQKLSQPKLIYFR